MASRNWNNTGRRPNNMNRPIYDRPSPWQNSGSNGQGPIGGSGGHLGSHPEALSLASNLLANILQQRNVPSLLDLPMRPEYDNYNRNYGDRRPLLGRMGSRANQGPNFNNRRFAPPVKRTGTQNFQFGNKNKPFKKTNQGNKPSDSKAAESAEGENKTEEEKTDANGESPKKFNQKTPYDGILGEFLHCHVCDKKMWDGRSFQNHINGRAHSLMMEKNKDSYALRADALRQELKLTEMKKDRHEKKDYYCAMCDIYAADAGKHRISPSHRRLKRYLHPACNSCHKQHATRIDFDAHRLSPQHLKVVQNTQKDFLIKSISPKTEPIIIYTKEQELVHVKIPRHMNKKFNKPNEATAKAAEDTAAEKADEGAGEEPVAEGDAAVEGATAVEGDVKMEDVEVKVKVEGDTETAPEKEKELINYITDYEEGNDLTGVTEQQLPEYSIEVGFGKSFIGDYHCKQCTLCNKILDTEETAEVHTRTLKHFRKFTNLVREKAGIISRKEQQKRALQSADDEDSKRRKLDDEGNSIKEEAVETAEDPQVQGDIDEEALLNEENLMNEDSTNEEQVQNGENAEPMDIAVEQTVKAEAKVEPVEAVIEPPVQEIKVVEITPSKKQPVTRARGRPSRGRRY